MKFLEREHSNEDALNCIHLANEIFDKVSVDLIFGTPLHKLKLEIWFENLEKILKLKMSHISLYQLSIEKRTKFLKKNLFLIIGLECSSYLRKKK